MQPPLTPALGIAFQANGEFFGDLDSLVECKEAIGVTVDGKNVRVVSGPKGLPGVGTYYEVYPDHLGNHQRMFETYGPIFQTTDMGFHTYFTNDPQLAAIFLTESQFFTKMINSDHPLAGVKNPKAGLFVGDTDTEAWRLTHKFLPAALSPKAVRHYTPKMQQTVERSYKVFDELDMRDEGWNVYPYMLKLGSATIGELALNMDLHHFDAVDAPLHRLVSAFGELLSLNKKVTSKGSWYGHLPFGDPARLRVVNSEIASMIEHAVLECQQSGTEDIPMADATLKASCIVDYAIRATDPKGEKLPHENMVAAIIIVTGAGFVTTASLLSWLIYALVTYPGLQDRLLQELIDNGITAETQWTYDTTNALPFLDKFIKETRRMHNPSFQPWRTAREDLILPGGYRVPAGTVVVLSLPHIHKNPALWDNPLKFDPDRWDTEAVKKRHKAAYIPFAFGQRGCIGFNFALQEVKVLIPCLVYRYEFSRAGDEPVEYDPIYQLIRPNNLSVRAKRRTSWPEASEDAGKGLGAPGAGNDTQGLGGSE